MSVHERISVSQVSSWDWSLDEDLAFYAEAGIHTISVHQRKLEATGDPMAAAARILEAGLTVSTLLTDNPLRLDDPEQWLDGAYELGRSLDLTEQLGSETLTIPTGAAGTLPWERAADALEEALRPTIAEAARRELMVLLEHSNQLRKDIGFVHSLRDTVELGWRFDTGACLEVTACWQERNLAGTITAGVDRIGLVRLSDLAIESRTTPDRLVPGDGDLPLARIVDQLLEAGYEGFFDIELRGPRIDEEGYATAIGRSLEAIRDLLEPPDDGAEEEADPDEDSDEAADEASGDDPGEAG